MIHKRFCFQASRHKEENSFCEKQQLSFMVHFHLTDFFHNIFSKLRKAPDNDNAARLTATSSVVKVHFICCQEIEETML